MATNKRIRGIAIHRSILIGSTATPLSEIEKITSPPDHTHKWTVAVRSAASHPLPTIVDSSEASASASARAGNNADAFVIPAAVAQTTSAPTSGVSTRGREHETDYHKMVGGKDDLTHFIKRVQFKLHETYPQSTRSIDRAPFQVTETGWGEFDIQVKIIFVAESGEKPLTTYHRLKLHPWHPISIRAAESETVAQEVVASSAMAEDVSTQETLAEGDTSANQVDEDTSMQIHVKEEMDRPNLNTALDTSIQSIAEINTSSNVDFPPVVHSWSYDEIVFPEPTEAFYEILIANPPTPFPAQSSQAFADVAAFSKYKDALNQLNDTSGPEGRDLNRESGIKPPHALHNSSGALFDALSLEAIQSEAERFDKARYNAVYQLEDTRQKLIEGERKIREGRFGQNRVMAS